MPTLPEIRRQLKVLVVRTLELELAPDDIGDDVGLFAPASDGGLELDSLAALEVFVALAREFRIAANDVNPAAFESISTLADYVVARLPENSLTGVTA